MCTLLDLPTEVILCIEDHLGAASSRSLRLTCRAMNQATLSTFAYNNFSTCLIVLDRRSLERLVSVAEHAVFGPAVRTLGLLTYHQLPSESSFDLPSCRLSGDEESDSEQFYDELNMNEYLASAARIRSNEDVYTSFVRHNHARRLHNQTVLLRGRDLAYLTRAMRSLPNCRRMVISDSGNPWRLSSLSLRFIRHAVDVMLKAAAASGMPVERLDFDINSLEDPLKGPFSLAHLDFLPLVDPGGRGIDSLARLRVSFCSARRRQDLAANENPHAAPPQWDQCLVQFLALFPRLQSLQLEFGAWTEHNLLFSSVSARLHMPHLQGVRLVAMEFRLPDLMSFLSRHESTLVLVVLQKIVLETAEDWHTLMRRLLGMPHLRHLELRRAFARRGGHLDEPDEPPRLIQVTDELNSIWEAAEESKRWDVCLAH